jgi:hypothetical protein
MTCPCYLISLNDFRAIRSELPPSIGWPSLKPGYDWAHAYDIVPVLGETCVADICARQSSDTLTADDQALLDAGAKFFAAAIFYRWLERDPSLQYDRAGAVVPDAGGYVQASATRHRDALAIHARDMAHLKAEFEQWLDDNRATYPCLPEPEPCNDGDGFYGYISGGAS